MRICFPEKMTSACAISLPSGKDSKAASVSTSASAGKDPKNAELEELKNAVVAGKLKEAVTLTKNAVDNKTDPGDIIDLALIAGLNAVGERFEKKEIFVPEMMISARTMQACMDIVKPYLKTDAGRDLGTVVIGTVFGDLHDIGKNLTKLLLESSGFNVIDLGENVPPDVFVAKQKRTRPG